MAAPTEAHDEETAQGGAQGVPVELGSVRGGGAMHGGGATFPVHPNGSTLYNEDGGESDLLQYDRYGHRHVRWVVAVGHNALTRAQVILFTPSILTTYIYIPTST